MLTYQQLDTFADSYIPLLGTIVLGSVIMTIRAGDSYTRLNKHAATLVSVILVYGLMLIDAQLQIWPRFGLDYSTHTALATVLVISIARQVGDLVNSHSDRFTYWSWIIFLLLTLVGYFALMIYQQYHGLADIVSTFGLIVPLTLAIHKYFCLAPICKAFKISS